MRCANKILINESSHNRWVGCFIIYIQDILVIVLIASTIIKLVVITA